tara:strand:+ start:266 stop:706 length:441 start_codon:yes stop_codon:yes gene_type:complete
MLIPIKCLTYSLLISNKNFVTWYNNNISTYKEKKILIENNDFNCIIEYEHRSIYNNRESLKLEPIERVKTSLFLNYNDDKYYERIDQKINSNNQKIFNSQLVLGNKGILNNRYLINSNYFLTKNNKETKYEEIDLDLLEKISKIEF